MIFSANPIQAKTYVASPDAAPESPEYYRNIIRKLQPGDTLMLPPGTYGQRLNLTGVNGTPDAWISITGPFSGQPAVVTTNSDCCNNVQLGNTSYVAIKNLTIDANSDAIGTAIDAVNAKGGPTHDILIENCVIKGVSHSQLTVGISTKSTAWNWTIRGNTVIEAGTGVYLGNSNGKAPFVAGMIERNLFVDSIGYNVQIKHQNPYSPPEGFPAGPQKTIIRDNVFLKRRSQSSFEKRQRSGARPNLLVGGFPVSGTGTNDLYEIYGNFFFQNLDKEALIQATGRVSIHDNIFVGGTWAAIALQDHNVPLELAHVYSNTIYGPPEGISLNSKTPTESVVMGNLIFADRPFVGGIGVETGNLTNSVDSASTYVQHPSMELGTMNFYPRRGRCSGDPLDVSRFADETEFDLDFDRAPKGNFIFRGAYAGEGGNPGWQLNDELKESVTAPTNGHVD